MSDFNNCLASVLDKIDQSLANSERLPVTEPPASSSSMNQVWYEYLDTKSSVPYYHNYVLNKTQWEKPQEGDIIPVVQQATALSFSQHGHAYDHQSQADAQEDMQPAVAYFSKVTGKFAHAGSGSYWTKTGREEDKAGRQLGIFMDLSTLEANREEAKRMKEEAQRKRSKTDWSAYKEEKKNLKKRKQQSWDA